MNISSTNIEIKVSKGRIVNAIILNNGTCRLTIETEVEDSPNCLDNLRKKSNNEENSYTTSATVEPKFVQDTHTMEEEKEPNIFELVEASSLKLKDKFMSYTPTTAYEKELKIFITQAIDNGIKDFYRPIIDPSFDENGSIYYKFGEMPAVNKGFIYWQNAAKEFCPKRGSRLGTNLEYAAFLGVLIKRLVSNGWDISHAWKAICKDSKELGHYLNSENAKLVLETTGSREVCGFYDLGNTYKLLSTGADSIPLYYCIAGGSCDVIDSKSPLSYIATYKAKFVYTHNCVGWIVLEK